MIDFWACFILKLQAKIELSRSDYGRFQQYYRFSKISLPPGHPTTSASPNSGQSNALTMKETSTMKAKLLTTIGCLLLMAGLIHAQAPAASFSLVDASNSTSGTYNPNATFTLTLSGTTNFVSNGFSMWLETNAGLAPHITITNETYVAFASPQDNGFPKAFSSSSGANPGFLTDTDTVINPQSGTIDSGDNGATGAGIPAGTQVFATITFQLSGAPAGTYSLQTTTGFGTNQKTSEITDDDNPAALTHVGTPTDTYTITVVPEPATLSLLGLGALGSFGLNVLRRHRRS
jgi:hypothetical protein